ncbi:methyltransferase domain-containing protein [Verrucomicrobiaceae bacterium 227]
MTPSEEEHDQEIREQFTKQAIPFTKLKGHLDSVGLLIGMTEVGPNDSVLDVACGPGLVACEFAKVAAHVSGIDLTEKMIEQARGRQAVEGLQNMGWQVGAATRLPFEDACFSVVISRYTFHHFTHPEAVLAEMIRVCKPGGRILVADPVLPAECVVAYNAMERLRDPSHTRALSSGELEEMFQAAGLGEIRRTDYGVEMELEQQLGASFPEPGGKEKLRKIFQEDVEAQGLGVRTRIEDGLIRFTYPISVVVGRKAGS